MYEYTDKSVLLNQLQKYDPLLVRSEQADEDAISYYVSSDVSEEVISAIGKETYSKVLCQASAIEKINSDKVLKAQLFNILERLKRIKCDIIQDKGYISFLNALYYFNTGTTKNMEKYMKLLKMRLFNGVAMKSRIIFALTIHIKEFHYMRILNLNHI